MNRLLHPAQALLLACAALVSVPAGAATLAVTVLDAAGQPAPDVAVVVRSAAPMPATRALPLVEIAQQNMRFLPAIAVVTPGTRLRFINRDSFDHHVRGTGVSSFSLRIAAPGAGPSQPGETVVEGGSGPLQLGCHLHSSMRAAVYVSDSPWYGVTDARGQLILTGLPTGALQVTLWHAQQLVEMPARPVQMDSDAATLKAALNFVPRQRR